MRMLLIGPPGAGKGTQCTQLTHQLGVPHISTGDMFRSAVQAKTPMGLQAKAYMAKGELVPDQVVIGLVDERIAQADTQPGFLLDGFPRTLPQAEALQTLLASNNQQLDAVVVLKVPDEAIVARIVGRRSDPETGAIYHLAFNPPPPGVAHRVVQRSDDTEQACRTRLAAYHNQTAPLIPFYKQLGLLRPVDGVGSPDQVTKRLLAAIDR